MTLSAKRAGVCLDLFSGIGGFALGFQRAGIDTVAFCETDPAARRILEKNFPAVPVYPDVRTLTAQRLRDDGICPPDILCGGFPCQDISAAGRGAGLAGTRSGLWFEYLRLIGETAPQWVVIENVPALRSRGLDTVLGGLAALGYDAEWHCVPASAVGAPHRRDRVWIVAYPNSDIGDKRWPGVPEQGARGRDADRGGPGADVADPGGAGLQVSERAALLGAGWRDKGGAATGSGWWAVEPGMGRVAHGVPARVDRLRCLGNAVVPQIAEIIGRAIYRAGVLG